jgi:hypothetical protein
MATWERIVERLEIDIERKKERITELEEERNSFQFDFNLKCLELEEKDKIIKELEEKLKALK